MTLRVYIGFDEREAEAARVAAKTLREVTGGEIEPEFLRADKLAAHGLLTRTVDHRGGQRYDMASNAPASTDFAISRFLVPLLCQEGWALFVDSDVVFLRDPREMMAEAQAQAYPSAVYVVQHDYTPTAQWKMVNQAQTAYPRKAWSSVMLVNCTHPANQRLTLWDVNNRPGRDLHRLYWLADSEIGRLDPAWNWLVNQQPRPVNLGLAHFTSGGPWLEGWKPAEHDDIWLEAAK